MPTKRVIAFIVCTCYKAQHDITPENVGQFMIYHTSTYMSHLQQMWSLSQSNRKH